MTPVDVVIERVRCTYRNWGRNTAVASMREDWDRLFEAPALPAERISADIDGVPGLWLAAPNAGSKNAVLYFHGGGFQLGSTRSHAELMAGISGSAGCRVLGIDYRLAPEHRFPAALDDARRAWAWLLAQGVSPSEVAVAGDSAGGNLVLALLLDLARNDAEMPACGVAMSAWTDLTASGEAYESRAQSDPIHQRPMIRALAQNYLGDGGDPTSPLASPLFAEEADLAKLPPLLLQVGDRETVLSDSTAFAEKARRAGAKVDLEVWDEMIHVFQQFPNELSEAREAVATIGNFVRKHFNETN